MHVLFSNSYTHKQNLEYLDNVFKNVSNLAKTKKDNLRTKEFYVIENCDTPPQSLKIMTMLDYAKEQQKNMKTRIRKNKGKFYFWKYFNKFNFI